MYSVTGGTAVSVTVWFPLFPAWQLPQWVSPGAPVLAAGGVGTFADASLWLGMSRVSAMVDRKTAATIVTSLIGYLLPLMEGAEPAPSFDDAPPGIDCQARSEAP